MGSVEDDTPCSYKQYELGVDRRKGKDAMIQEMIQVKEKGIVELFEPPPMCNTIRKKWDYMKKKDAKGSINRLRVRLAAKDFTERKRIDNSDVFSPIAKYGTLRFFSGSGSK